MKNRNYAKGRELEYKIKDILESQGYTCYRTAGSHSLFDVIAENRTHIRHIQAKSVSQKHAYFDKELEEMGNFKNLPLNSTKELWVCWKRLKSVRATYFEIHEIHDRGVSLITSKIISEENLRKGETSGNGTTATHEKNNGRNGKLETSRKTK